MVNIGPYPVIPKRTKPTPSFLVEPGVESGLVGLSIPDSSHIKSGDICVKEENELSAGSILVNPLTTHDGYIFLTFQF